MTDDECDRLIPILFRGLTYHVPAGQSFDQAARSARRACIRRAWVALHQEDSMTNEADRAGNPVGVTEVRPNYRAAYEMLDAFMGQLLTATALGDPEFLRQQIEVHRTHAARLTAPPALKAEAQ